MEAFRADAALSGWLQSDFLAVEHRSGLAESDVFWQNLFLLLDGRYENTSAEPLSRCRRRLSSVSDAVFVALIPDTSPPWTTWKSTNPTRAQ